MGCPPTLPAILPHGSWVGVDVSLFSCPSSICNGKKVGQDTFSKQEVRVIFSLMPRVVWAVLSFLHSWHM